jgi:transposase
MVLSIEERVLLVEYVFREGNRYTDLVKEQFAEKFPETPVPHLNAVRRLTEKFCETGSVLDAERSGRPSTLNDKKLMDISDSMLRSPSKSLRKLVQEEDIGLARVHKAVREQLQLFPYNVRAVQELRPAEKKESVTVNGSQILFKRKLLIFLMSPSLQMRAGSTSQVMLTHKTYDCGLRRILMLCMKNPCMTRNLECGLRYLDGALLVLYSLKKQ